MNIINHYIKQQNEERHTILTELHHLIVQLLPENASQTMTYQIPTYRTNGTIIQFAQLKNHVNIYPGSQAMPHLKEDFPDIDTTQLAFKIPNTEAIPKALIEKTIQYNLNIRKNNEGMNRFIPTKEWKNEHLLMEKILAKTPLIKTFKWNRKVFTHNGENIVSWGGFKHFFSVWFYNGVFLEDPDKALVSGTDGKTKSLRQWRFKSKEEMNEYLILSYINEAIKIADKGLKLKVSRVPHKAVIDPLLKAKLKEDEEFKLAFYSLTPGRQREYFEYLSEAKQETTKIKRLEKIIPQILNGAGLHDKYKR